MNNNAIIWFIIFALITIFIFIIAPILAIYSISSGIIQLQNKNENVPLIFAYIKIGVGFLIIIFIILIIYNMIAGKLHAECSTCGKSKNIDKLKRGLICDKCFELKKLREVQEIVEECLKEKLSYSCSLLDERKISIWLNYKKGKDVYGKIVFKRK